MKVSALIEELTKLHSDFGDMDIFMAAPCSLDRLDFAKAVEDIGVVLWPSGKEVA